MGKRPIPQPLLEGANATAEAITTARALVDQDKLRRAETCTQAVLAVLAEHRCRLVLERRESSTPGSVLWMYHIETVD